MATKENESKGGYAKGKGLCNCCDSSNCGKRHGPYPKKRTAYLGGQKKRVPWRNENVNEWNNDYYVERKKLEKT